MCRAKKKYVSSKLLTFTTKRQRHEAIQTHNHHLSTIEMDILRLRMTKQTERWDKILRNVSHKTDLNKYCQMFPVFSLSSFCSSFICLNVVRVWLRESNLNANL